MITNFKKFFLLVLLSYSSCVLTNEDIKKATFFFEKGEFEKSKEILLRLEKQKNTPDSVLLVIKNNLANIYVSSDNNSKALRKYFEALSLSKKSKNSKQEVQILNNIGNIFSNIKNYKKANEYFKKCLFLAFRFNDDKLIGDCYNNIGIVQEQQLKLDLAYDNYIKALEHYQKNNSKADQAMVYSNIAIVLKSKLKIKESIEFNKKALNICKELNNSWMTAAISNNLGNAYLSLNQVDSAFVHVKYSLDLCTKNKYIDIEIMALETLSEIFEKINDNKKALFYFKKMQKLNNEYFTLDQSKQINELEIKYKSKEKELKFQAIKLEKIKISNQNKILIFSLLAVIVLVSLFIYFNRKLQEQKLEKKKQNELNSAIIESENNERFRIARDLHDSVGQMLSVIKMQLSTSENSKLHDYIDQTITEVRTISHNLIPEALNFGLKRAIEELIDKLDKEIVFSFDDTIYFNKNEQLNIYRILQELIANSLKHNTESKIEIELSKNEDKFIFIFSDLNSIFDKKMLENSSGLGWKNIKARVFALNGKIELLNKPYFSIKIEF
jgi:signal transduction histidine kinase